MIERLRGTLLEKDTRHVILECAGVGYGLDISLTTFQALSAEGQSADLHVHTYMREDTLQLFGFAQREERSLFLLLLTISGVGPSLAMTLLSSLSPAALARAIESGDATGLTRVKGIGKRTAERLVLELKGKLKDYQYSGDGGADGAGAMLAGHAAARDAIAALANLGMKEPLAEKAVTAAIAALPDDASVEQLVVEGLKWRK